MEIRKYYESWYESTRTVILVKDEDNVFKYEYEECEDSRHNYFVAHKNRKEIPEREHNIVELEKAGKTVLSKGVYRSELNGIELSEEEADDLDFDEFVDAEERQMLLSTKHAEEMLAAEEAARKTTEEEEARKAAKEEAAKKAAEEEAAKKAAEEKARLATYGDAQDVAVLKVLHKALQQSKKPKMLISYAARFCPRFKSGRFEQPRTIIRAGGREYAFQFGYGWERIY